MITASGIFDLILVGVLVWLAFRVLAEVKLFKSVVLYIAFGLLMAFAWVRLSAPDIALAEAAIGVGITGALLLDAAGHMRGRPQPYSADPDEPESGSADAGGAGSAGAGPGGGADA